VLKQQPDDRQVAPHRPLASTVPTSCSTLKVIRRCAVDICRTFFAVSCIARHNVVLHGPEESQPVMFAHGFGCDQNMWRLVWPHFSDRYRIVLFDHMGSGRSDARAYDEQRYSSLKGYAEDVLAICQELDLRDVVFVGHSVSAMIGVLAAAEQPDRFARLVLVGPSPRYIDDAGYMGGFSASDIDELLDSLESNYLGWSSAMAPVIMGNPERPQLGEELTNSFCRTDPTIARQFARVTFLSDNRGDLGRVRTPSLVLQCREDAIAPPSVGEYVDAHLADSRLVLLNATGHCPNLSAPEETAAAIRSFLEP
jgi:sigma-B regulation protein RsbQ